MAVDEANPAHALLSKRRWIVRLLLPHAVAVVAFMAAAQVMSIYQTNRTALDFYLGMTGYLALVLALIGTTAAAILHPWRTATARDWLWLVAHVTILLTALSLGSDWMGRHIA